jgi:hypothetical protein
VDEITCCPLGNTFIASSSVVERKELSEFVSNGLTKLISEVPHLALKIAGRILRPTILENRVAKSLIIGEMFCSRFKFVLNVLANLETRVELP